MPEPRYIANYTAAALAAMSDRQLAMHFVAQMEDDPRMKRDGSRALAREAARRGLTAEDLLKVWEACEAEPATPAYVQV
jgi:hypothetical protein